MVHDLSDLAKIQGSTWEGRCPNCQGKGERLPGLRNSVLGWFHWCGGGDDLYFWQETEEQLNEEYEVD